MPKRPRVVPEEKFDAYNTAERTGVARARVEKGEYRDETGSVVWSISPEVSKAILSYVDARAADRDHPLSGGRVLLYFLNLPRVAATLGNDFLEPTKQTPAKFSEAYRSLKGNSRKCYADILGAFWTQRFEEAGKEFPSYLRIRISKKARAMKTEDDALGDEEQERIARATVCDRDEAFVKVLWEGGLRLSECLGLDLKDVTRNDHGGFLLHVDGKTGRRPVPLFGVAVPALSRWLAKHPAHDDPEAPLFCGTRAGSQLGKRLTYGGVMSILQTAARRAGVEKAVNPHIWRHSRATAVARNPEISPAVMNQFFGWAQGSRTSAVYTHMSGRDVEESFARSLGVAKVEPPIRSPTLPKNCPRCEFVNDSGNKFCGRCSAPLDPAAVGKLLEIEANTKSLATLLRRPEVAEFLAQQLAALQE